MYEILSFWEAPEIILSEPQDPSFHTSSLCDQYYLLLQEAKLARSDFMGKSRRLQDHHPKRNAQHGSKPKSSGIQRRHHSQIAKASGGKGQPASQQHNGTKGELRKVKQLYSKYDRVLLVGEGDFSFAASLAKHYDVGEIVATSYDNYATLKQKYSHIDTNLSAMRGRHLEEPQFTIFDSNAADDEEWNGFSPEGSDKGEGNKTRRVIVIHDIDATALPKSPKKLLSQRSPFTKIVFNFPHIGGLSTDVNRQVRANQELLVGFFNAAKPLLATRSHPAKHLAGDIDESALGYDSEDLEMAREDGQDVLSSGRVLVTLFEGEPYSLWNLRDLARHCGLQVVESFKFPWPAFPGYKHARTIGDIVTGKDRVDEGKRRGAWRGEERDARCFVLALKEELRSVNSIGRKRQRDIDSEDSD